MARTININGTVWKYQIGKSNVVARAPGTKQKRVIDISTLTGVSWNEIERAQWKKFWFAITPQHIADWLRVPA